jgi:hypothetical protein
VTATDLGGGRPHPAALAVLCADPAVREKVVGELHKRYSADYAVVTGATVDEVVAELASVPDRQVALVLSGYSNSEPEGLEALAQVSAGYPQALRAAVVRWGELDIAESIFAAVTAGLLDAWVFRPGSSGDEEFHLAVTELLDEWANRNGAGYEAVQLIGERWSARSTELRDMFIRNHVPTGFYDAESDDGQELLRTLGLTDPELPVVVLRFRPNRPVLTNPNAMEIAAAFGLLDSLANEPPFDVAVLGAGPSGLSAAV